jgi:hypothetical protein
MDEEEDWDEEECYEEEENDDPDHDDDTANRFANFVEQLEAAGFEHIGFGSFRQTFMRGNIVVKVPRNPDGITDNMMEAMAWRKYKSKPTDQGIYLAPCRLLPNMCLMMVAVDDSLDYDEKPAWAACIDCKQVGKYKDRVVAFDYALDLTERHRWERELNIEWSFFQDTWLGRKPQLKDRSLRNDRVG